MKISIAKFTIWMLSISFSCTVKAQEFSFNPFPQKNETAYHLDFSKYFNTEADEKKDLGNFYKNLDRFYLNKNKVLLSTKNLLASLLQYDSLLIQYHRQYIYHNLLSSVNKNDHVSRDLTDEIDGKFLEKTGFLEKEISNIPSDEILKNITQAPKLGKYSYYIKDILRKKQHQVSPSIENKINNLMPAVTGWQFDLYSTITDNIKFEDIKTTLGQLNVKGDKTAISANQDSSVREAGFKKLYNSLNSSRNLFAFALIKLSNAIQEDAVLHNFTDAEEYYYFDKYHTKKSINAILKQISDSVAVYKNYQQMVADYKKSKLRAAQIHYWDLGFSTDFKAPKFTIDSANQILLSALQPLGNDYQKELSDLLNPNNGRMEIAPGKNKRSGGFSRGFIGTNSTFFTGGYRGFYNDMRVLTHESTHAVHRQLMNANNVLPVYASGPNYFFESFAIFSEFLLTDYLLEHANTKAEKQYYLEEYFNNKGMALFSIAGDALLESKIHEGIKNGTINNADDLDTLTETINKTFSIWDTKEYPQLNQRWITASLFYEDPFYEINYVLGALLALKYYQLYKVDKQGFSKKYIALLKNGFNATPDKLLKTFLDIDINDPNLVQEAIIIINSKVNQLKELYK